MTALDAFGNLAKTYRGQVVFTSTDPQAVLPALYTFTAADGSKHVFKVKFKTAGSQSLTVADKNNPAIQPIRADFVVNPPGK